MKRYIRLYKAIIRNNLAKLFEFRLNFFIHTILSLTWMGLNFLSLNLIFSQTDKIGGWNKNEMILYISIFFISNSLHKAFFHDNITNLPHTIREGKLDFILTKPLSSQFFVSTIKINFYQFSRTIVGLAIAYKYLPLVNPEANYINIIPVAVLITTGVISMYCFLFLIACYAFIKPGVWNLFAIMGSFKNLAEYPSNIYKGILRFAVLTLPIATFATIPTLFLMGKGNTYLMLLVICISGAFVILKNQVWKWSLKRYESASS